MWEQIRDNQVRSVVLVITMGILLMMIGLFIGYVILGDPVIGIIIAFIVWLVMNLLALFEGDKIMLEMSGAKKIGPDDHPRLYNVVEEMKIASGLEKMPDVYIIDDPAMNAFATGRDSEHAAIAVTSGMLDKLNRDELQGVVGHEIGHIKNHDIRLMLLSSILLGSIVILSYYATRIGLFSGFGGRRGSGEAGGALMIIIILLGVLAMILAPIFAQVIYFAISRHREYLADASSALYTRYPEGLASALEKLANNNTKVKAANKATAPMYISNPYYRGAASTGSDLFATHPPLAERIRILRAMSGASYKDYEASYKVARNEGIIGKGTLALEGSDVVAIRPPSAPEDGNDVQQKIDKVRETSDLLWRLNKYKNFNCGNCGAGLKLPPNFSGNAVRCPHCGIVNQI